MNSQNLDLSSSKLRIEEYHIFENPRHQKTRSKKRPESLIKSYIQPQKLSVSKFKGHFKRSFERKYRMTSNKTHALTGLMTYAESIQKVNQNIARSKARVSSASRPDSNLSRELMISRQREEIRSNDSKDRIESLAKNLILNVMV